jgi:hypothetical protein
VRIQLRSRTTPHTPGPPNATTTPATSASRLTTRRGEGVRALAARSFLRQEQRPHGRRARDLDARAAPPQAALVHINTLLVERVLSEPACASRLTDADRRALTPLFWTTSTTTATSRSTWTASSTSTHPRQRSTTQYGWSKQHERPAVGSRSCSDPAPRSAGRWRGARLPRRHAAARSTVFGLVTVPPAVAAAVEAFAHPGDLALLDGDNPLRQRLELGSLRFLRSAFAISIAPRGEGSSSSQRAVKA